MSIHRKFNRPRPNVVNNIQIVYQNDLKFFCFYFIYATVKDLTKRFVWVVENFNFLSLFAYVGANLLKYEYQYSYLINYIHKLLLVVFEHYSLLVSKTFLKLTKSKLRLTRNREEESNNAALHSSLQAVLNAIKHLLLTS